jgi:hypothetical protein
MEREAEGNENERDLENPITTFVGLFFSFSFSTAKATNLKRNGRIKINQKVKKTQLRHLDFD